MKSGLCGLTGKLRFDTRRAATILLLPVRFDSYPDPSSLTLIVRPRHDTASSRRKYIARPMPHIPPITTNGKNTRKSPVAPIAPCCMPLHLPNHPVVSRDACSTVTRASERAIWSASSPVWSVEWASYDNHFQFNTLLIEHGMQVSPKY